MTKEKKELIMVIVTFLLGIFALLNVSILVDFISG